MKTFKDGDLPEEYKEDATDRYDFNMIPDPKFTQPTPTVTLFRNDYEQMVIKLDLLKKENDLMKSTLASIQTIIPVPSMTAGMIFDIIADMKSKLWELEAQGKFNE